MLLRSIAHPLVIACCLPVRVVAGAQSYPKQVEASPEDQDDDLCLDCHADVSVESETTRGAKLELFVGENELSGTSHEDIACIDCHRGAVTFLDAPHNKGQPLHLGCLQCHEEAAQEHRESVHGPGQAKDQDKPSCQDCHGRHDIYASTDLRSRVNKFRISATCGSCHGASGERDPHRDGERKAHVDVIHGPLLLRSGLSVAPSCSDCHGAHDIEVIADTPGSSTTTANVHTICSGCHVGSNAVHEQSIHGKQLAQGNPEAPTCIRCHPVHDLQRAETGTSRQHIDITCGRCHQDRLERYRETFHGKAMALGRENVATCSDCHGHHDVQPSSEPSSRVHNSERVETCRNCHPDSNANFAAYQVHADHTDKERNRGLYWVYVFMTALLIGTMVFFALHTLLWMARWAVVIARDLPHFLALRRRMKSDPEQFVRFRPIDRFLHVLVISSFLLLALTGIPLKFYDTDWAKMIFGLLQGQEVAGRLHRLGAVITLFYFVVHLLTLAVDLWTARHRLKDETTHRYSWGRGKEVVFGPDSPLPNLQDLRDLRSNLKWFLRGGKQPQFDRWTYWEKFDYMAVFWGVAMVGASGLILWFPEAATTLLPGWSINVALVLHSEEALLATGFIFIFHFFNTHMRPEKFPIDTVMFSGRVSRTELQHGRRRLLVRWQNSGALEQHRIGDEWSAWRKIVVPLGMLAFLAGVFIVVLICSTMVSRTW